jgi:hypothetical protein
MKNGDFYLFITFRVFESVIEHLHLKCNSDSQCFLDDEIANDPHRESVLCAVGFGFIQSFHQLFIIHHTSYIRHQTSNITHHISEIT